jgi:hypothetical protein
VEKLYREYLGQGRVEVEHEWIGVAAEFGNDEGHALKRLAPLRRGFFLCGAAF